MKNKNWINLFLLKVKFAASSALATVVDYFVYILLVTYYLEPVVSNLISASIGMVINFIIQKRYIFQLERKAGIVFLISAAVSVVGIGLSTLFIFLLTKFEFFYDHQFITKAIVVFLIFNYNFYFKRFAFEKRFLPEMNKKDKN